VTVSCGVPPSWLRWCRFSRRTRGAGSSARIAAHGRRLGSAGSVIRAYAKRESSHKAGYDGDIALATSPRSPRSGHRATRNASRCWPRRVPLPLVDIRAFGDDGEALGW
jgi:hypothetical protein